MSVLTSPVSNCDQLVTLRVTNEQLQSVKHARKLLKSHSLVPLFAVPVDPRLPWIQLKSIPDDFIQDLRQRKNVTTRYYLASLQSESSGLSCTITSSFGVIGNLDTETARILRMN